jgi:hypothetical protein
VPGISDRAGPASSSPNATSSIAFRLLTERRHPEYVGFRGSITPPTRPLSTLRCALTGHQRMTQGHRDLPDLRCRALSSPTPCRFIPALSSSPHSILGRFGVGTYAAVRWSTPQWTSELVSRGELVVLAFGLPRAAENHAVTPFSGQSCVMADHGYFPIRGSVVHTSWPHPGG